jgi:(2Fe-2S) ferredoxin
VPPFQRHVFICTNRRPAENPKGCCAAKGSEALADRFKERVVKRGLKGQVRANSSGCLDACEHGASVVVYPDNVWYGGVTVKDVDEIVEEHLVNGRPVERLRIFKPPPP